MFDNLEPILELITDDNASYWLPLDFKSLPYGRFLSEKLAFLKLQSY